jgi:hypothetical protein
MSAVSSLVSPLIGFGLVSGYQGVARTDLAAQVRHTVDLKTPSSSWGLLQGPRETAPP